MSDVALTYTREGQSQRTQEINDKLSQVRAIVNKGIRFLEKAVAVVYLKADMNRAHNFVSSRVAHIKQFFAGSKILAEEKQCLLREYNVFSPQNLADFRNRIGFYGLELKGKVLAGHILKEWGAIEEGYSIVPLNIQPELMAAQLEANVVEVIHLAKEIVDKSALAGELKDYIAGIFENMKIKYKLTVIAQLFRGREAVEAIAKNLMEELKIVSPHFSIIFYCCRCLCG